MGNDAFGKPIRPIPASNANDAARLYSRNTSLFKINKEIAATAQCNRDEPLAKLEREQDNDGGPLAFAP